MTLISCYLRLCMRASPTLNQGSCVTTEYKKKKKVHFSFGLLECPLRGNPEDTQGVLWEAHVEGK